MEFHAEIEKEEKKEGWVGAREGAGRKRKGVHYYGFRATQEVHDILSQVEHIRGTGNLIHYSKCVSISPSP